MEFPAWKRALIDEDEKIDTKWSLPTLQTGLGKSGSLVSPLTVDNAFLNFLQASPTVEADHIRPDLFTGGLDRLKKFEATLPQDVESIPPQIPSKDNSPRDERGPDVPSKDTDDSNFPSSDGNIKLPQTPRSVPSTPSRNEIITKFDGPPLSDAPITRVLPRRTVSISAARMRLKLDTLPPVPTLKRASTLRAPASPSIITPESRPLSEHSPTNDAVLSGNLEDSPERGRTVIPPRSAPPEHTRVFSLTTSVSLTRKPNTSRSRSRKKSTKSRPTTPSSVISESSKSVPHPMDGSKFYEGLTFDDNTFNRDEPGIPDATARPRVPTHSILSTPDEDSQNMLSPESVQTDSSLTPHVHSIQLTTRTSHGHTSSTTSLRSRSQSVPVTYPSTPPPSKQITSPSYPSANAPISIPDDYLVEAYPSTPVTPPSFARPPKQPVQGSYPDPTGFPSPPSYPPVPGLVASGSSSTSARSSAYTSSGASAPLSSTDLSALGAGLGTFENREESSEIAFVEDKEWETSAAISSEAVMPASYSSSISFSRPLVRESSVSSIARLQFATNAAVTAATNSQTIWNNEPYASSTYSANSSHDGSPVPLTRSDQYFKRPAISAWRNVDENRECDTDLEHDQLESHPPPVPNYSFRRPRMGTANSSRSARDEEARTAAIVVAEEGRGLIVHGEGQDVNTVNIPAGTTHLLLTTSATPSLIPSLLTQTLPNIAHTLLALDISGNFLPALPPVLVQCTQLTELNIANNPLRALPVWLVNLEGLRVLIADATGISTLPSELAALKALSVLSIRRNKMMSLPSWLSFLPALEQLEVEGNPFQGPWKALLAPLITSRQSVLPSTPLTNDHQKSRPNRDHSVYGPGLSVYADTSSSHLSFMVNDLRPNILTPNSAFYSSFAGSGSESPIPPSATDQSLTNGRRFIQDEEDNTIVPRVLSSSSELSLPAVPSGLAAPISPALPTGNSQTSFATSLNSPSLLPYTSSPVNNSPDIEEALADIGKNSPHPIQRAPTFSVSDRRSPSPYLRPLSRNRSTPNRSRLSAGSANGSIATFIADQGNGRSRTSSAASQRPLTDYSSSRYGSQRSIEDSGYYGNTAEYNAYQRQSEGSEFFGALRSNEEIPDKTEAEEEKKKELRRMRSADELRRALEPVIGPSEPLAPRLDDEDDNGGETTETDRRPPFFVSKLDARPKLSQLQTSDIGTIGPSSASVLNDRFAAKKFSSLSAAQGLAATRRRPALTDSLFDTGIEADAEAEDEKLRTQETGPSPEKVETPQKSVKGKWGFLKKMSMGRMRPDPPVPRLTPSNGLPSSRAQTSPQSATLSRPPLPTTPNSALRPRAATRNVLSPMTPLSAPPSTSTNHPHSPSLTVPATLSRAAKRRSFLPLDGPPSLNIPIPTTSPFFPEGLIAPIESEEEQPKLVIEQEHKILSVQKNDVQTAQHNEARILRGVMAYLRDMADLSVPTAVAGSIPSAMPSSANLATASTESADGRARRPTIAESGRVVSEGSFASSSSGPSPSSQHPDDHRINTTTADTNGSSKGEEERSKYKEDKLRRVKIIKEIVETERTYVQGLQELIDIYVKPAAIPINTLGNAVAATKETVIPQQERKMVFNGLDSLYSFHTQSFLPALERATTALITDRRDKLDKLKEDPEIPTEVSMDAAVSIAQVFVSHAAFMRMYSTYINNFDNAFERLKHWTQDRRVPGSSVTSPNASTVHLAGIGAQITGVNVANLTENSPSLGLQSLTSSQRKRIKQYLKRCRMNPKHSQINLEAYLLLPVQRIPRYRMLLDELVRCTPPKPELPSDAMERALSEIASLANNMNEGKREAESRRRLVQWQTRIRGKFPSPLVQPHRRLIMDGPLTLTRVVRKTSITFDLINAEGDATNMQVECLAPEETPRSLVGILCNDLLVLCKDPSGGQDQTAQVDLWAVLRMQTRPQPASITQGNSLRVVDNKAILYFDAPSTSEALTWCRAINMNIPTIPNKAAFRSVNLRLNGSSFHSASRWKTFDHSWKVRSFTTLKQSLPTRRWRLTKSQLLWLAPLVGFTVICFRPTTKPKSPIDGIFSSPAVIPCQERHKSKSLLIQSPYEDNQSFWKRITKFFTIHVIEQVSTLGRFFYLCVLFVPVLVSSPMLLIGSRNGRKALSRRDRIFKRWRARLAEDEGERWGALWWYGFLVRQMQKAGPTFIKAGLRTDLFPDALCEKLGTLHSSGKPHSLEHTKRVIQQVFGRSFDEVFEEFNETPIGVGAIAQVYRAKLRHDLLPPSYLGPKRSSSSKLQTITGSEPPPVVPTAHVAIKIQHPNVEKLIRRDLTLITFLAQLLALIPGMKWISLPEEVEVFGRMMHEQLDLRIEARNLKRFEENFAPRKAAISFPRPLEDYSTKEVLIEEYENALPLKAFLKHGGGPFDDVIAESGLDTFLKMLLLDNFVHSDLHPGNIMIKFYRPSTSFLVQNILSSIFNTSPPNDTPTESEETIVNRLRPLVSDPSAWREELDKVYAGGFQPELVFIDAGLVTTLDAENRRNFLDLFRAIAEFDGYRAGRLMVERCRSPELAIDPETFALKMQHLVLNVKSKTFSLAKIKISEVLTDVLRSVRQHHVRMEGDFINTVLAVLLLEGIGRQLDPKLDLFKSSLPILRQLGKQMAAQEKMKAINTENLGTMLKVWVWIEARELISSAIVNIDDMIKYDW
ncbi:hypothetical protein Clacol_003969 [Clathrus columnatus]|uniref:DH domain-containing protein n=1 Tax=Clathrus columnatus TaxID=1419009 RepID=A0AAV5ACW0_9AGAM|nr:hypothetical protein Clacol_003969 [Clathrus columnatus]